MILNLLASIAMVTQPANEAADARPANDPDTWITVNDYPLEEIENKSEGITSFRLTVGPDGLIQSCDITGSSGSYWLDITICPLVKQRARFHPALNKNGKPVIGSWNSNIHWQVPDGTQMPVKNSDMDMDLLDKSE